MKERPILFKGEMVRAILHGRKTQTRRVVKLRDPSQTYSVHDDDGWPSTADECGEWHRDPCPFGVPGDRLWVRETWADVNSEEGPAIAYRADSGIRTWRDFSTTFGPNYGAGPSMDYDAYPGSYAMWWTDLLAGAPDHSWKPSIHMPRWASRLTLEVIDVRVERLNGIREEDAQAEGALRSRDTDFLVDSTRFQSETFRDAFAELWDSINGTKPGCSWADSPWVWCISFNRVESKRQETAATEDQPQLAGASID